MWSLVSEQASIRVVTVSTESELNPPSIPPHTPIYVDRQLANKVRGEDVLRRLHAKGFTKLYLFTGDTLSDDELAELDFVNGVVGKTIPPEVYGRA